MGVRRQDQGGFCILLLNASALSMPTVEFPKAGGIIEAVLLYGGQGLQWSFPSMLSRRKPE